MTRTQRFWKPDGSPKHVRCYDNGGETFDRYTVVFTGRYRSQTAGSFVYIGMSCDPYHPQGFGQHGESDTQIDRPRSAHLGRKIAFAKLPEPCKRLVRSDYAELWRAPAPVPATDRTRAEAVA